MSSEYPIWSVIFMIFFIFIWIRFLWNYGRSSYSSLDLDICSTLVCRHSVSEAWLFYLGDFSRSEECTYSEAVETIWPLIAGVPLIFSPYCQSPSLVFTFMRVAVFICRSQTKTVRFWLRRSTTFYICLVPNVANRRYLYIFFFIHFVYTSNEESIHSVIWNQSKKHFQNMYC